MCRDPVGVSDLVSQAAIDCCKRKLRSKFIRLAKNYLDPTSLVAPAAAALVLSYDEEAGQSALFALVNTIYSDVLTALRDRDDLSALRDRDDLFASTSKHCQVYLTGHIASQKSYK